MSTTFYLWYITHKHNLCVLKIKIIKNQTLFLIGKNEAQMNLKFSLFTYNKIIELLRLKY